MNPESVFADGLFDNRTVLVDFTADWCLSFGKMPPWTMASRARPSFAQRDRSAQRSVRSVERRAYSRLAG